MRSVRAIVIIVACSLLAMACKDTSSHTASLATAGPAPDSFRVAFETSRGRFVVQVNRALSPKGVDRFHGLVAENFFDNNRFFRVLPGFIAQFGVNDDHKINEIWEKTPIADEPARTKNLRGTIVFAMDGPNSRAHQFFINLADNANLDKDGFVPLGRVVEGMSVVDSIYSGYGDKPSYHMLATLGNSYLIRMFPKLDYIKSAKMRP
jgi:peptidyl-prolyl cis-trans isomerase A (cyclophilin A)